MIKYLVLILTLVFSILTLMYFFVGVPKVYPVEIMELKTPHVYNDQDKSIAAVKIAAFYFIPLNKTDSLREDWYQLLEQNLIKIQNFHNLQLRGRSYLSYEIYPTPVIGLENNLFYDTENTQYGNPQALLSITNELKKRVFDQEGDLYSHEFSKIEEEFYRSIVIIYEGVGASGNIDSTLVSIAYLTDPQYEAIGVSILTHEFYHTLGVPDGYEFPTSIPFTQDIMGLGRLRPLEKTYINHDTLGHLGL